MQTHAELGKNFPLHACLTVCYMLRLEVRHFGAENGPHPEILMNAADGQGLSRHRFPFG
jgi:hypothetical protein